MKNITHTIIFILTVLVVFMLDTNYTVPNDKNHEKTTKNNQIQCDMDVEPTKSSFKVESSAGITPILADNYYKLDLIADVTMAEVGGNHCTFCETLVIDTILNRIEDNRFANTVEGVILDSVAFETVKNKSIYNVNPNDSIYKLILKEIGNRTCNEVLAFQLSEYHDFGYPVTNCHDAYYSGIN